MPDLSDIEQSATDGMSYWRFSTFSPSTFEWSTTCISGRFSGMGTLPQQPEAGSVAEVAADRKSAKYTDLNTGYSFQPVAL